MRRGARFPLSGWNTLDVLVGERRVVHRGSSTRGSSTRGSSTRGVGTIEVLCLGPRRDFEVYDLAAALTATGRLTDDEVTQLWLVLALNDVVAESVGSTSSPRGLRTHVTWSCHEPGRDASADAVTRARIAGREGANGQRAVPLRRAGLPARLTEAATALWRDAEQAVRPTFGVDHHV
ncbi:MAG: hypothetical protein ACYDDW_10675 [Dermatophilaceae bacterium]